MRGARFRPKDKSRISKTDLRRSIIKSYKGLDLDNKKVRAFYARSNKIMKRLFFGDGYKKVLNYMIPHSMRISPVR